MEIKSDYLSRFWLEIVGVIEGYFDESGEFQRFIEDEEDDDGYFYYDMRENVEIVLGVVTGYAIDKTYFSYCNEYGNPRDIAITFDCISQILSDLWCSLMHGKLKNVIEFDDECFLSERTKVLYYLDDIYYTKGFEDLKIDKAVINLLKYAIEDYLNKDLEDIVYEPYRSDLFEPIGFVDANRDQYIKRINLFKDQGYLSVSEAKGGLKYFVYSINSSIDLYGEEIELEEDEVISDDLSDEHTEGDDTVKTMYKDEKSSDLNRKRAEAFAEIMKGGLDFDELEGVWCFNTARQSKHSFLNVSILFFEGAAVFRVIFDIPEKMDNEIFKKKVLKRAEDFNVLDEYPARIVLIERNDGGGALMLNIAYPYNEDDYEMDDATDILVFIAKEVGDGWDEYIDAYDSNKSSNV